MDIVLSKEPFHEEADPMLMYRIQKKLTDCYPGYTWIVKLDEEDLGGVVTIMCLEVNEQLLGLPNWGYVLKVSRVYSDPDLKCVMRAGGEILESAGISRNRNFHEVIKEVQGLDHKRFPLIKDMFKW